ncbi:MULTISPECIES: class D beta-lactamase [unclassified Janthinobacterium]|uniref:class D beta-lactamase n=1 Tax=unclassified Janthinobacterium TaxID=2610881 RepID=UPI00160BFC27|nr:MULTISPECIES: class D beta-lactamase [unclassified Janthinobacterium]MBB5366595.1 beta-lactamase class D [Janthinobacterium sp. K2C7]MBB5380927.1 beta-lactamase class D [Janthinobacterium sp. K2Li3]MBB5384977.1 beta-lactamase class D [Janthinobacterium sp. K2E3]
MMLSNILVFRFLLASFGCLLTGLVVWGLMALCRRRFPVFSLQRASWLLSQIAVVATFAVILLPHSERLRLAPPIELPESLLAQAAAPHQAGAGANASSTTAESNATVKEYSWLSLLAQAWLLAYLLGLAYTVGRLWQARRVLHGLAAAGTSLHERFGVSGKWPAGLTVTEVDAPISPMLFGLLRPHLLLPGHLRGFEPEQQQMIIEHELMHLRRRDLHWMSVGLLLQTLLWFNPFMRLLRNELAWAQELGCDRDVLASCPPSARRAYAAALVAQLRLQHRQVQAALAFGGVSASTVAARIGWIREPGSKHGRWARGVAIVGLAAVSGGSLVLQPALAWRVVPPAQASSVVTTTPFSCTEMVDAGSGQRLMHDGHCDERVTPASTFNIVVSLMGYDSAILRDEHTPRLPFKVGYTAWNPDWRVATDPTSWIHNSTVWYAQQVTTQLGVPQFQRYIKNFNYGNQDVSGDVSKNNGLTMSWIASSLKISPVEQVAFLRSMVNRQLPVSAHAYEMTSRLTSLGVLPNGWEVHGKTGTASPVLANGKDDLKHSYGWFVGWASKGGRTVVFSRLVLEASQPGSSAGPRAKEAFLRGLPAQLDAL